MNKIEKLHLDAIDKATGESYYPEYSQTFSEDHAAELCSEITEQIAIEFADWVKKNWVIKKGRYVHKGDFYNQDKKNYTTKDLFQGFIKLKQ